MEAIVLQSLVRRLLTHEAKQSQDQRALLGAAEHVCDKLRVRLSRRLGRACFQTLLVRALTMTTTQFPSLRAVQVEADASLVGLPLVELRGASGPDVQQARDNVAQQENAAHQDAVEGAVSLLEHFFGLLIAFIGEEFTLRLLNTVSPRFALPELALLSELALDDAPKTIH